MGKYGYHSDVSACFQNFLSFNFFKNSKGWADDFAITKKKKLVKSQLLEFRNFLNIFGVYFIYLFLKLDVGKKSNWLANISKIWAKIGTSQIKKKCS